MKSHDLQESESETPAWLRPRSSKPELAPPPARCLAELRAIDNKHRPIRFNNIVGCKPVRWIRMIQILSKMLLDIQ